MPTGIYKRKLRTSKHRRNLSRALKGNKCAVGAVRSQQQKQHLSNILKGVGLGIKLSEEHKSNISKALTGRTYTMSEEGKRNISRAHKGKRLSISHRQSMKGRIPWNKGKHPEYIQGENNYFYGRSFIGELNPFYGKHHTQYSKQKNREAHLGKTPRLYPIQWNKVYREQIRHRDNYKCQICGVPQMECIRKLDIHHVDENKHNINPDNLISLCRKCHAKTFGTKQKEKVRQVYVAEREKAAKG